MRGLRYVLTVLSWVSACCAWGQVVPTLGAAFEAQGRDSDAQCLDDTGFELGLNGAANLGASGGEIQWWRGTTPGFDPTSEGFRVVTQPIAAVDPSVNRPGDGPKVVAIQVDGCNGDQDAVFNDATDINEALLAWSGTGFDAGDFRIDYESDNGSPDNDDLGPDGACPLRPKGEISPNLVLGSCVFYADATDVIPADAFVIVFPSSLVDQPLDAEPLNALGYPVYVLQSSCERSFSGVFSNEPDEPRVVPVNFGNGFGTFTYVSVRSEGDDQSGWTVGGETRLYRGCGEIPAPEVADQIVFADGTADVPTAAIPLDQKLCGTWYYRATFEPAGDVCPPPPSTSIRLIVDCPTAVLSGGGTACAADPPPPVTLTVSQASSGEVTVDITGPEDTPSSASVPVTGTQVVLPPPPSSEPGVYLYEVSGLTSAEGCDFAITGSATVSLLGGGDPACENPVDEYTAPLSQTVCRNTGRLKLKPLEDPNYPGGLWDGDGVVGILANQFDTELPAGKYPIRYIVTADGVGAGTAVITLVDEVPYGPLAEPSRALCVGESFDLRELQPGDAPAGTWTSGDPSLIADDGFTFTASGESSADGFEVTFEPELACADDKVTRIRVDPARTVSLRDTPPICEGSALNLNSLILPGSPTTGQWSGDDYVSGSTFAPPAGSAGQSVQLTYARGPQSSACFDPVGVSIVIGAVQPIAVADAPACEGESVILANLLPVGAAPGAWTATGGTIGTLEDGRQAFTAFSAGATSATVTFTPTGDGCLSAGSGTITLVSSGTGSALAQDAATVCANEAAFDLGRYLVDPGTTGTWRDASGDARGSQFDPSTAPAVSTLTFVPADCREAEVLTVTLQAGGEPLPVAVPACEGDVVDLTLAALPDGVTVDFPSDVAPGGQVSLPAGTQPVTVLADVLSAPDGTCYTQVAYTITPGSGSSGPDPGDFTYCAGADPAILADYEPAGNPGGQWTTPDGTPVTTFSETTPGTYTLLYSPPSGTGTCGSAAEVSVTVLDPVASEPIPVQVCPGGSTSLLVLIPPEWGDFTFADPRVTDGVFDATTLAEGDATTVIALPAAANPGCYEEIAFDITAQPSGGAGVTLGNERACGAINLYDLYGLDPADGSWDGVPGGGADLPETPTSYDLTFTPAGDCGAPQTVTVTVEAAPAAVQVPACEGDVIDLTSFAPAGLALRFDPATVPEPTAFATDGLDGIERVSAEFDPVPGVCGTTLTFAVEVRALQRLAPVPAVVCSLSLPVFLPDLQDPNFPGGTFSLGAGGTITGDEFTASASGDYPIVYIPPADAGECFTDGATVVTVVAEADVPQLRASTCESGSVDLNALSAAYPTPLGPLTFEGPGVQGNVFTATAGLADSVVLTASVDPSAQGCYASVRAVVLLSESSATFVDPAPALCPTDDPFDLATLLPDDAAAGSWQQSDWVAGSVFDPARAPAGPVRVDYRVDGAACARDTFVTVVIGGGTAVTLPSESVCADEGDVDLSVLYAAAELPPGRWLFGTEELSGDSLEVAGLAGQTIDLLFEPTGDCGTAAQVTLRVTGPIAVGLRPGAACAGAGPVDLDELITGSVVDGIWTADAGVVTGSSLDASGVPNGEVEVTFTPASACALPASTIVRVGASLNPFLRADTACVGGDPIDLSVLVDPDFPTGTWSGAGVDANAATFDPRAGGVRPGVNRISFTPDDACAAVGETLINVLDGPRPQLQPLEVCRDNNQVIDLTELLDPAYPTGTWSGSPAISGDEFIVAVVVAEQGPIDITFTPDLKCARPGSTQITFAEEIVPELGTVTLCASTANYQLSNLADPRFPGGSWNGLPVVDNAIFNATTVVEPGTEDEFELTFTPDAACGAIAYTTVLIRNEVLIPKRDSAFCGLADPFDLSTLLELDIPGTWSDGAVFDPTAIPSGGQVTRTFTPDEVGCYQPTEVTLSQLGLPGPGLSDLPICAREEPLDLVALLPDPALGGFVVDGVQRVSLPVNLVRDTTYAVTYVPADPCSLPETFDVTVSANAGTALTNGVACGSGAFDLNSLFVDGVVPGSWSGPATSGSAIDVAALTPGTYTYTFTPVNGACAEAPEALVQITPRQPLTLPRQTLCLSDPPLSLADVLPAGLSGSWSGPGVDAAAGTFDPAETGAGTVATLDFAPSPDACYEPATLEVAVTAGGQLPSLTETACVAELAEAIDLTRYEPPRLSGGAWSRAGQALVLGNRIRADELSPGTPLIYSTPGACGSSLELTLTAAVSSSVSLGADQLCADGTTLPLDAYEPASAPGGTWTLQGATVTQVDATQPGTYAYAYAPPAGSCVTVGDELVIEVSTAAGLDLAAASLCTFDPPLDLDQLLPPSRPAGVWTLGDGTVVAEINPATTPPGDITVTFAPDVITDCASTATTTVSIESASVPTVSAGEVCATATAYDLRQLLSAGAPPGDWLVGSDPVPGGLLDATDYTAGQRLTLYYIPQSACGSPNAATLPTTITILPPLGAVTVADDCVAASTNSFDLTALLQWPTNQTAPSGQWSVDPGTGPTALPGSVLDLTDPAFAGAATLAVRFEPDPQSCYVGDAATLSVQGAVTQLDELVLCAEAADLTVADLDARLPAGTAPGAWTLDGSPVGASVPVTAIPPEATFVRSLGAEACAGGFELPVSVFTATTVSFVNTAVCAAATPTVELANLLGGAYGPGAWSSVDVVVSADETVDITGLANGGYALTFAPDAACTPAADVTLDVLGELDYALTVDTVCAGGGPVDLTAFLAPAPPSAGTWTGTGVSPAGELADGPGDRRVPLVFEPAAGSCAREVAYAFDLYRVQRPTAEVDRFSCEPDGSTYTAFVALDVGPHAPTATPDLGTLQTPSLLVIAGLVSGASAAANVEVGGKCGATLTVDVSHTCAPERGGPTDIALPIDTLLCPGGSFTFRGEVFDAARPSGEVRTQGPAEDTIFSVTVAFRPEARFSLQRELCEGETLTVGSEEFSSTRLADRVVLPGAAVGGCDSIVDVSLTFAPPSSEVTVTGPAEVCLDGSDILLTANVSAEGQGVIGTAEINGVTIENYTLPEGQSTVSIPGAVADPSFRLFAISAVTTTGCDVVTSPEPFYRPRASRVEVGFVGPSGATEFATCGADPVPAIGASVSGGIGPFQFAWSTGETVGSITDVDPGTYEVTVTDDIGCTGSGRVVVASGSAIAFAPSVEAPTCPGTPGSARVTVAGADAGSTYRFDGGASDALPPDGQLAFDELPPGQYTLLVDAPDGCFASTVLDVAAAPELDLTEVEVVDVARGTITDINIDLPAGTESVTWSPTPLERSLDGSTASFLADETQTISVEVLTADGCVRGDRVDLFVGEGVADLLPTAFSPNGDGQNDFYAPVPGAEVERVRRMSIFDRWGTRVFYGQDLELAQRDAGWNGQMDNEGEQLPTGVYVVSLEVEFFGGRTETFAGELTLLR